MNIKKKSICFKSTKISHMTEMLFQLDIITCMYLYYLCFKNVHRSCSKISSPSIIWSCKLFWYYAISLQKICAWFLSWIWYIHLLIVVGYVSGQWHRPGYRLTLSLGSRCSLNPQHSGRWISKFTAVSSQVYVEDLMFFSTFTYALMFMVC